MPSSVVGRRRLQHLRLKLKTMGAVADPGPARGDELPGRDRGRMSDHRDEVALASRLHLEDGKPVLCIVEGHPLDSARERLDGGAFWA